MPTNSLAISDRSSEIIEHIAESERYRTLFDLAPVAVYSEAQKTPRRNDFA